MGLSMTDVEADICIAKVGDRHFWVILPAHVDLPQSGDAIADGFAPTRKEAGIAARNAGLKITLPIRKGDVYKAAYFFNKYRRKTA